MRSDHDHDDDHDDLDMSRSRSHDLVDELDHGITGFDLLEHMISRSVCHVEVLPGGLPISVKVWDSKGRKPRD